MPKSLKMKLDLRDGADFRLVVPTRRKYVVSGTDAVYTVRSEALTGYTENVDLSVTGLPTGASATIGTDPIGSDGSTDITVETTGTEAGVYEFTIGGDEEEIPSGDIFYADSPSFSDVQAAINAAGNGDTVRVPAGSANWGSEFVIDKFINLIGAGSGLTHITSTYTASDYLIYFMPSDPSLDLPMRISGIDFDFANKCYGIHLLNTTSNIIHSARIDNCILENGTGNLIGVGGPIYGVAYLNTMTQTLAAPSWPQHSDNHNSASSWVNSNPEYGTANNFYYEDNIMVGLGMVTNSGGQGNRYVSRHNTITNLTENSYWMFDMHGSYDDSLPSTMCIEVYNNTIHGGATSIGSLDQRGSMALFYNNTFDCAAAYMQVRNEYGSNVDTEFTPATSPDGSSKRINRSYYWNNRNNGTLIYPDVPPNNEGAGGTAYYSNLSPARWVPYPDKDFWTENPNFNGSANLSQAYDNENIGTVTIAGMGVGLLAARPASPTVADVGYWATDTNTLYRWRNSAWETFYTPYAYPHPLRVT